jgi:hypothetical protein
MQSPVRSSPRLRARRVAADGYVTMDIGDSFLRYSPVLDLVVVGDKSTRNLLPPPTSGYICQGFYDDADKNITWPFRCTDGFWVKLMRNPWVAWSNLPRGPEASPFQRRDLATIIPKMFHWPSKRVKCSNGAILPYTEVPEYEIVMETVSFPYLKYLKTPATPETAAYPSWYHDAAAQYIFLGQVLGIHPSNEYYDRDPGRVRAFVEAMDNLYDRI